MLHADSLFESLTLPNGQRLPNRLAKAAMEENLADYGQLPGERLFTLYRQWADGGVGTIITGNVMVAPAAMTGPGGVVLQDDSNLAAFAHWAEQGRSGGGHIWMQINHPGRQIFANMGEQAVAPSDVAVDLGKHSHLIAQPKALTQSEIEDIITRFGNTAQLAEQAGFNGVQIHAAHGYLLSQFLSPLTNKRDDQWGGPLENRARLLLSIVKEVRGKVGAEFCVSIKLNSADFQKGGFTVEEAEQVVAMLNPLGVDCIELSGGSYESPAMQGATDGSTSIKREAYFVDFARRIARTAQMPIMVTGGITKRSVAIAALEKDEAGFGVSLLGIARALAFAPDLPNQWKADQLKDVHVAQSGWSNQTLGALANMALTKAQLERLAQNKAPKPGIWPIVALIADRMRGNKRLKSYRAWRDSASA
jgi:2,4-dienoyl-CoA reductase-like NADH-dependent reductase (Old Yellow Enzyme family)